MLRCDFMRVKSYPEEQKSKIKAKTLYKSMKSCIFTIKG